jgi:hypothetical protein
MGISAHRSLIPKMFLTSYVQWLELDKKKKKPNKQRKDEDRNLPGTGTW